MAESDRLTPKEERFVAEYMIDQCGSDAARRAGYSPKSARCMAPDILARPRVLKAIERKRAALAKKAEVTAESVARELEEARALAMQEKQTAAAVSAAMGKAKLFGLIVERHKHSGAIGSYDLSRVSDADLDRLEQILGPAAADPGTDPGGEETPGR